MVDLFSATQTHFCEPPGRSSLPLAGLVKGQLRLLPEMWLPGLLQRGAWLGGSGVIIAGEAWLPLCLRIITTPLVAFFQPDTKALKAGHPRARGQQCPFFQGRLAAGKGRGWNAGLAGSWAAREDLEELENAVKAWGGSCSALFRSGI